VLEFLHQQHKQMQLKESEWALEKSLMQSRVKELEGVMQGLEKVVTDLGRRCKMLEVALRQERIKHQRGGTLQHDFVGQLL
jgi:striatin 1/3/4